MYKKIILARYVIERHVNYIRHIELYWTEMTCRCPPVYDRFINTARAYSLQLNNIVNIIVLINRLTIIYYAFLRCKGKV